VVIFVHVGRFKHRQLSPARTREEREDREPECNIATSCFRPFTRFEHWRGEESLKLSRFEGTSSLIVALWQSHLCEWIGPAYVVWDQAVLVGPRDNSLYASQ